MKIHGTIMFRLFANDFLKKHGTKQRSRSAGKSLGEDGFITVVIVLMMLVLITIIGISAINMSMIEGSIVRTDGLYKRNFYLAESAAYEAAQRLENTEMSETDPTGSVAWVVPNTVDMTDWASWRNINGTANDYSDDTWTANSVRPESFFTSDPVNKPANLNILIPPNLHTGDSIRLSANFVGVTAGSSLKVTNDEGRLYAYNIYGMFSNLAGNEGEVLIEMGYKKRF